MALYLGRPVSQVDGSWAQNLNCVLASSAELADCSSVGYYRPTPSRLRSMTGDYVGGVTYDQAKRVIADYTNNEVNLTVIYWAPENLSESTLNSILNARRVTGISIDAGVTRYTPFRTGTFTGGHTVVVGNKRSVYVYIDGRRVLQKQALVMDPGHSTAEWVWWPWSLLIKAAKARTGGNMIHVLYTRDLTSTNRLAKSDGAVRSAPKMTAMKVGEVVKGQVYFTETTMRGGAWSTSGHSGIGWTQLGVGRYAHGGRIR